MNSECLDGLCSCEAENNFFHVKILRDGEPMAEFDSMGREIFWEDLGRKND